MKKLISLLMIFLIWFGIFNNLDVHKLDRSKIMYGAFGGSGVILPTPDTVVDDPAFMENYFLKLDDFGYNFIGTCSYVATSMFMSYYDSYWNDLIIPESYDVKAEFATYSNSIPVSKSSAPSSDKNALLSDFDSKVNSTGVYTCGDYLNFINSNYNTYHHLKLISDFGVLPQLLYGDSTDYLFYNNQFIQYHWSGLTASEIYRLVSNNMRNYGDVYNITSNVRNEVINKIKSGIPVILGVSNVSSAHVVVAYDYDDATNTIYTHSGYEGSKHVSIEQLGYSYYDFAIYFTPSSIHNCSNNYSYNFVDYCVCELDGTHPRHNHSYDIINNRFKDYHNIECICTCESIDYHTVVSGTEFYDSSGARCALCHYCGYKLNLTGNVTYYLIYI